MVHWNKVGNVSIKLTDEMVKGLKKGGWTENILVDLLKEMELQILMRQWRSIRKDK